MKIQSILRLTAMFGLSLAMSAAAGQAATHRAPARAHAPVLKIAPSALAAAPSPSTTNAPAPVAGGLSLNGLTPGFVPNADTSLLGFGAKGSDALSADLFDSSNMHARLHYFTDVGRALTPTDRFGRQHSVGISFTLSN